MADSPLQTRSLVLISTLLSVGAFFYVIAFAPIPEPPAQVRPAQPELTVGAGWTQIRRELAIGHSHAATDIANRLADMHPRNPLAWHAVIVTRFAAGRQSDTALAGLELESLASDIQAPMFRNNPVQREYLMGWAHLAQGRTDRAQAMFASAGDRLDGNASASFPNALIEYNLACYRAMAGQLDRAVDHFVEAVEGGYSDPGMWWLGDPDLDPIRSDPRFIEAERVLFERTAINRPLEPDPRGRI